MLAGVAIPFSRVNRQGHSKICAGIGDFPVQFIATDVEGVADRAARLSIFADTFYFE